MALVTIDCSLFLSVTERNPLHAGQAYVICVIPMVLALKVQALALRAALTIFCHHCQTPGQTITAESLSYAYRPRPWPRDLCPWLWPRRSTALRFEALAVRSCLEAVYYLYLFLIARWFKLIKRHG